jgi:hypothetical protein
VGAHQALNASAAVAAGLVAGVPLEMAAATLANASLSRWRMAPSGTAVLNAGDPRVVAMRVPSTISTPSGRPSRSATQQQRVQRGVPQSYFDVALRLHDKFNAPRTGESRTTAALTGSQLGRLLKGRLTRTNGEARLQY